MPYLPRLRLMADHLILCCGVAFMCGPVAYLLWQLVAGLSIAQIGQTFLDLWRDGLGSVGISGAAMMANSLVLAFGVAVVKLCHALPAAYALVWFRLPAPGLIYGAILIAMFFPVETRVLPTFLVTAKLGLLNSYTGMILPVAASGLGVLVFTQFMKQLPPALIEAARLDGAGPLRILWDIVIPMSAPMAASLFTVLFVLGWNQYLWPLMVATTSVEHDTLVRGISYAGAGSRAGLALALLAMLPPVLVLICAQRWMLRGLTVGIH
ncbi:ABC transporter permease subunit [Tritonibacter multivorans]|uniref:ABC transporter permease subunit n=1 Tax=Tritonibacter multivorans TaxID=928856 RepID=UPI001F1943FD|nr:ABC transporter permease subunit [Tritonibacter multivorans]MDA7420443.1 ABC transporter permease subunit [Tritonibacter multivorans]